MKALFEGFCRAYYFIIIMFFFLFSMWSSVKAVYYTKPKEMVYSFKRHFGTK